MDHSYTDSSKYQISLQSVDSRFSDLKNNVNSEFRVQIPNSLRNIIRIRLASIEVPLVEPMFSLLKGNVSFRVKLGTTTNYVNSGFLLNGNYSAGTLLSAFQTQLQTINTSFLVSMSSVAGLVTITNTAIKFTIDFTSPLSSIASRPTHWGLGYYLGFRDPIATGVYSAATGGYSVTAPSILNVQPNSYYLLKLKCPDEVVNLTHRIHGGSFVSAFAKIVLTDNYYQVQFDNNANLMRKEYTFVSPINIPFFQVSLVDPWGELVNMMDTEWSYTIEVTEIKSSNVYNTIVQKSHTP